MIISRKFFLLLPPLFAPILSVFIYRREYEIAADCILTVQADYIGPTPPSLFDPSPRLFLVRRYRVIQVGRQAGGRADTPCTYRGPIELGAGGGEGRDRDFRFVV